MFMCLFKIINDFLLSLCIPNDSIYALLNVLKCVLHKVLIIVEYISFLIIKKYSLNIQLHIKMKSNKCDV